MRPAFALAALLAAGALQVAHAAPPGCLATRFVLNEHQVLFSLPHGFLVPGSDSVWTTARRWVRGHDYDLDYTQGELRLLRPPVAGETLQVSVCRLLEPPPLAVQRITYRPVGAPSETVAVTAKSAPAPRPATVRTPPPAGATLQLAGNKTVAVDFGANQDASLRQSLDLTVSGKLTSDVELAGVLSDRNTPLGVTGATQDVQSLDRVLLELRAPQGTASLGDITLDLTEGEFGHLSRRLQGARGTWNSGGLGLDLAATSTQGEFNNLQFFGQDGQQGPYQLTDRAGRAVSVVAGSEAVFVDGVRLARGESADYSIDYDRGTITFTNRRPISSASRIAVDYQFSLDRYRRNLAAAGTRWERGALRMFTQFVSEADDRGRPLGLPLGADDRLSLAAAGDSAGAALGAGVIAGPGDYDQVTRDGVTYFFVFSGVDSGDFAVSFAPVGAGRGDYAESTQVAGRPVYRYAGPGAGDYRPGRALPLPDSHQLWTLGSAWRVGGLQVEGEGALSRLDRNTLSSRDDGDDQGRAGKLHASWEGDVGGGRGLGRVGLSALYRAVDANFQPFTRLEAPFAQEDWGLPLGADLDHQERAQFGFFLRPRPGGQLSADLARLRLPDGFDALRRSVEWASQGTLALHGRWERAEGEQAGRRFADGGREKRAGELRLHTRWLEPALRFDWDERRAPSDTARAGDRYRTWGAELRTPAGRSWSVSLGHELRHDDRLGPTGFAERFASRTLSAGLDAQTGGGLLLALGWQRQDRLPRAEPERLSRDLGYSRLQLATADRRATGNLSLEVTSEAESRRVRELRRVGPGLGAYDSLGNFVGRGDYDLQVWVGPEADRVARGAVSGHGQWQWGGGAAWRGSRVLVDVESEARRRGDLRGDQLVVSPGRARSEAGFSLASALWRLDQELAPESPVGGLRLLLEQRVTADRSFQNFSQVADHRLGSLRWRAQPGKGTTVELEARLRRQEAVQEAAGPAGVARLARALEERGGSATLARAQGGSWRVALLGEAAWTELSGGGITRLVRAGPEGWLAVGERGRLEASVRRSWLQGGTVPQLLPTATPESATPWEGTLRADYRVPPGTQLSASLNGVTREGRRGELQGRAEVRVFF